MTIGVKVHYIIGRKNIHHAITVFRLEVFKSRAAFWAVAFVLYVIIHSHHHSPVLKKRQITEALEAVGWTHPGDCRKPVFISDAVCFQASG